MSPEIFKQEDVTFHVPTTLPPHAVTFGQVVAPLEPEPPPLPVEPPEPPLPPAGVPPPVAPVAPMPAEFAAPPPESMLQPAAAAVRASDPAPRDSSSRFLIQPFESARATQRFISASRRLNSATLALSMRSTCTFASRSQLLIPAAAIRQKSQQARS